MPVANKVVLQVGWSFRQLTKDRTYTKGLSPPLPALAKETMR